MRTAFVFVVFVVGVVGIVVVVVVVEVVTGGGVRSPRNFALSRVLSISL